MASISLRKFSACLVRSENNFQLGQLGDAVDQIGDLLAEIRLDVLIGGERVLDRVVQQRGDDGGHVELEVGEDGGDFQRMGEIGIARGAELLAMRRHGIDIGLVEQRLVGVGVIGLDPVDQLGLAHQLAPPRPRSGRGRNGRSRLCRPWLRGQVRSWTQYIGRIAEVGR